MINRDRVDNVTVHYVGNQTFTTKEEIQDQIHEAYFALLDISYWDQADILSSDEFLTMWHEIESSNRLHQLTVSLKLNERGLEDGNKASTDYVVAMCADMIGLDSLILDIDDTLVRIISMHETTLTAQSDLSQWCRYESLIFYFQIIHCFQC